MIKEQPNDSETIEPIKNMCLLIDDQAQMVRSLNRYFSEFNNFKAVECHSVDETMAAIKVNSPKFLFLDNSLTPGGEEGLDIAIKVREMYPDMEIYSTTNNRLVTEQYLKMGIDHIEKDDLEKIQAVITTGEKPE